MPVAKPRLETCERVLIVEGYSDLLFFAEALEAIHRLDGVFIKEMGGKKMRGERAGTFLETFLSPRLLAEKTAIGVIVDADDDAAGTVLSFQRQLSDVTGQEVENGQWTGGPPRVGLFVAPGDGKAGEIESLVWEAWSSDPLNAGPLACVETFLGCMSGHALRARSPDKGRISAVLSVLSDEDPRLGPGARDRAFDLGARAFRPLLEFLGHL